jgi:hypothetical protein
VLSMPLPMLIVNISGNLSENSNKKFIVYPFKMDM